MSDRTEQLISELARDLQSVRALPRLRVVAALVLATWVVVLALYFPWGIWRGVLMLSSAQVWDLVALGGHLLIGAGGLALALGSCIPGRESLELRGLLSAGVGVLITVAATVSVLAWMPLESVTANWYAGTALCTCAALALAVIPAVVIARFAARGAPRRPSWTLLCGAISMLALGTLPGHIGCAMPGALHTIWGHILVPATGALAIYLVMRAGYFRPRPA